MSFKFNPTTGKLDLVGTNSAPVYLQLFNSTTDWGSAVGGYYQIEILSTTHGKGLNPVVTVYELNGLDYEEVTVAVTVNSLNGNVTIGVLEVPDARFEGKLIIS